MASPVQIVLNPENYEEARVTNGGGGRKDFFAHRDREFRAHQAALIGQLESISGVLSAQSQGDVGFVKVILRREAWAKSHRPMATLFRNDRTPIVGGGGLGVSSGKAGRSEQQQVMRDFFHGLLGWLGFSLRKFIVRLWFPKINSESHAARR